MDSVSPVLVDRLLAISRALAGHVDPGEAFRATAVEIETLIPYAHMNVAVLLDEGRSHACCEAGFRTSWSAQLRSRIIVPMRAHGTIVGALNISRHEPDRFTESDCRRSRWHRRCAAGRLLPRGQRRHRQRIPARPSCSGGDR